MIFNKDELQYIQNTMISYKNQKMDNMSAEEISAYEYLKDKIDKEIKQWEQKNPIEKTVDDKFFKFMNMANYYKTNDYQFIFDMFENKIEVSGGVLENIEYARITDSEELSEYIDEEVEEWFDCNFQNDLRFCSICGAPMQEGFISENSCIYIDSEIEFFNYMNSIYGLGNWRCATPEEESKLGAVYVYRENTQSNNWKATDWSFTEWKNNYSY